KAMKGLRVTNDDATHVVQALKAQTGGDIWLFGGGALFRSLLDAGLVDTVEVALIPVLLGSGIPLLPPGAPATLEIFDRKVLPASGIVMLSYRVKARHARGARIRYVKARRHAASRTPGRRSTTGTPNSAGKRLERSVPRAGRNR